MFGNSATMAMAGRLPKGLNRLCKNRVRRERRSWSCASGGNSGSTCGSLMSTCSGRNTPPRCMTSAAKRAGAGSQPCLTSAATEAGETHGGRRSGSRYVVRRRLQDISHWVSLRSGDRRDMWRRPERLHEGHLARDVLREGRPSPTRVSDKTARADTCGGRAAGCDTCAGSQAAPGPEPGMVPRSFSSSTSLVQATIAGPGFAGGPAQGAVSRSLHAHSGYDASPPELSSLPPAP